MQITLLTENDLQEFVGLLSQLSPQSKATIKEFYELTSKKEIYIGRIGGKAVATISLIFEHKANRPNGICVHIEDVVVDSEYQGGGLGKTLMEFAIDRSKEFGAYKIILDCSQDKVGFYQKCGFEVGGVCMRLDCGSK